MRHRDRRISSSSIACMTRAVKLEATGAFGRRESSPRTCSWGSRSGSLFILKLKTGACAKLHDISIGFNAQNGARPRPVFTVFWPKMTNRQRFLDACHCRVVDRPPVWLMRQAGRALPEYRELKAKHDFLKLVRTPALAAEVTLQPIRRFDFDAAILFSDILVTAEGLGQGYQFRDGGGIQMDFPLREKSDIARLDTSALSEKLSYVPGALQLLKKTLGEKTALIGFAGSPWTLANFMLEGGSAKEFIRAKNLFYTQPEIFSLLMEKLTEAVITLL